MEKTERLEGWRVFIRCRSGAWLLSQGWWIDNVAAAGIISVSAASIGCNQDEELGASGRSRLCTAALSERLMRRFRAN